MSSEQRLCDSFKRQHLPARTEWLADIVRQASGVRRRVPDLDAFAFAAFLTSDIRRSSVRTLPPNVVEYGTGTLTGTHVLQLLSVLNISEASFEEKNKSECATKRMLRLTLCDAAFSIEAVEMRKVDALSISLPFGCKVAVRNAPVRRGRLMLDSHNTRVLGGFVKFTQSAEAKTQESIEAVVSGESDRKMEVESVPSTSISSRVRSGPMPMSRASIRGTDSSLRSAPGLFRGSSQRSTPVSSLHSSAKPFIKLKPAAASSSSISSSVRRGPVGYGESESKKKKKIVLSSDSDSSSELPISKNGLAKRLKKRKQTEESKSRRRRTGARRVSDDSDSDCMAISASARARMHASKAKAIEKRRQRKAEAKASASKVASFSASRKSATVGSDIGTDVDVGYGRGPVRRLSSSSDDGSEERPIVKAQSKAKGKFGAYGTQRRSAAAKKSGGFKAPRMAAKREKSTSTDTQLTQLSQSFTLKRSPKQLTKWNCLECTLENSPGLDRCQLCETAKPPFV